MTNADRKIGCFLGMAIGDALGAAVEFKDPGTFEPVTTYRGNGPHRLDPGEWTDDTSMALALADSILSAGWDLNDQADRYLRWYRSGEYSVNGRCFDIGYATRAALQRYERSLDAASSGDSSSYSSGNGSIMRLAPVPIIAADMLPGNVARLAELAVESSLPTHASEECLSACRYFTLILAGLINGEDRDVVLAADWPPLVELGRIRPLHPAIAEVVEGSFRQRQPPEIEGSGYVVKSLEAALWAMHDAADFRTAVLRAVNLGDDADTTGAVCGQLAGAYWGQSGIDKDLCDGLTQYEMLRGVANRLANVDAGAFD